MITHNGVCESVIANNQSGHSTGRVDFEVAGFKVFSLNREVALESLEKVGTV